MKKLYVGNLPFQATEQDISNWFKQAGANVANVTLVTDKFTGQPRGFGFVEINSDEGRGGGYGGGGRVKVTPSWNTHLTKYP